MITVIFISEAGENRRAAYELKLLELFDSDFYVFFLFCPEKFYRG